MFILATQPQSIFKVLADGFRLFKASIAKVWYWQLLFILPSFAISLSGQFFTPQNNTATFLVLGLSSLLAACIMIFGQCFVFSCMNDVAHSKNLPASINTRPVLRKTFPALAGVVLISIVILTVFVLIANILQHLIKPFWAIYTISAILALFLILIPQLFFIPLLIFEKLSVFKAIKKGFQLVWGSWWRTFFLLILLLLIFFLLILLFGVLNYLALSVFNIHEASLNVFGIIEALILNIVAIPFFYAVIIVQYYDLDLRKFLRKS